MSKLTAEKQRSRRNAPQVVRRLLLFGVGLYLLPLFVLTAFQRQLVFGAHNSRILGADDKAAMPPGSRMVSFRTAEGDKVAAYYGSALWHDGAPDPDAASRPTLLFFYGQGGSLNSCRAWFRSFRRMDINVLMPDYVGFGRSSGQESEANCDATAVAAYRYLCAQPHVASQSIVIAGYSLGSGVAVDLAAREVSKRHPPAGLALFAAYANLADEAHRQYPIYPAFLLRLLLRYSFASKQKMPRVTCPVLLVHSHADRLIPYWMSDRLAAASGGPVTRIAVTRIGHADYFGAQGRPVFVALSRFIEKSNTIL